MFCDSWEPKVRPQLLLSTHWNLSKAVRIYLSQKFTLFWVFSQNSGSYNPGFSSWANMYNNGEALWRILNVFSRPSIMRIFPLLERGSSLQTKESGFIGLDVFVPWLLRGTFACHNPAFNVQSGSRKGHPSIVGGGRLKWRSRRRLGGCWF